MIKTCNPTFIFPTSLIPNHKQLFNFTGTIINRNELTEEEKLIVMLPVCFADTLNLIYDANGNLVTGDESYRVYNSLNQLWKVYNGSDTTGKLLQEFTYHPTEERVLIKQNYNISANETVYYVSKDFIRIVNDSGTYDITYVYHEGQLIAERDNGGTKVYYHPDHLGSTTLITDSSGNAVENTSYTPYGVILTGGEESRFDYEGKEFDSVTETYDFHFRGYKADWAIFTQPDSLLPNVYDPQQLNRYSFERNNPYSYIDPDGHAIPVWLVPILIWANPYITVGVTKAWEIGTKKIITLYLEAVFYKAPVPDPVNQGTYVPPQARGPKVNIPKVKSKPLSDLVCENQASSYECLSGKAKDNTDPQAPDPTAPTTPVKPTISDEANRANTVSRNTVEAATQAAMQQAMSSGGGFVSGLGYVAADGTVYPTSNPDFVPTKEGGSGNEGVNTCTAIGDASCPS